MKTIISTNFENMTTEAVNISLHEGVMKCIEPKRNAVIIDFVESVDGEGEKQVSTIITVECMDEHLYKEMKEYALGIALKGDI